MKRQFFVPVAALALLATPIFADDKPAAKEAPVAQQSKITIPTVIPEKPALKDEIDRVSYALGMNFGSGIKMAPVQMKLDLVMAGLRDYYSEKAVLTDKEKEDILSKFEKDMSARDAKEGKERAEKNKKDGVAFLAENKKKEGVKTTPSGLQYKVLKDSGTGVSPKMDDTVMIHYSGTFIDGTVFDSSYKRKAPTRVPLRSIIRGWSEALQMMKPGDKWQVVVPSDLGYGDHGAGREVPPNATLIYEMELLSIEGATAKK